MDNNIVQLPFGIKDVKAEKIENEGDISVIYLTKQQDFGICPACGTITNKVKDKHIVKIIDIPIPEIKVKFRLNKRRFKCVNALCSINTFTESVEGLKKSRIYSDALVNYIYHSTKRSVCADIYQHLKKDYGLEISRTSFYRKQKEACLENPINNTEIVDAEYIGLDEFAKGSGHDYGVVVTNLTKKKIIEMVDGGKTKETAKKALSFVEQKNVKACCMDMWEAFKTAVKETIPHAIIVIDPFHVVKTINDALDNVRKRTSKILKPLLRDESFHYLKKLILSGYEKLTDKEVIELWKILYKNKELKLAYEFKELLRKIYAADDPQLIPKYFKNWIREAINSKVPEIVRAAETMDNWFEEITNWWKHPISNGFTEGVINKIKTIDRKAYHYNNFESLRYKVLTIQNSNF